MLFSAALRPELAEAAGVVLLAGEPDTLELGGDEAFSLDELAGHGLSRILGRPPMKLAQVLSH